MYSRLKFVGNMSKKLFSDLLSNYNKVMARLFSLILRAAAISLFEEYSFALGILSIQSLHSVVLSLKYAKYNSIISTVYMGDICDLV